MTLAKTTRPSLADVVARPRLYRRLDHAARLPVTWISGPPGAGKTTLVAHYLVVRRIRHLWYQLDEGDRDIATFFYHLSQSAPRRRQPLPLLTVEYRHSISLFAKQYFRDLYSRLTPPFVLVFDSGHDAPDDAALHEVMRDGSTELPRGGRLMFISRAGPPPSFARLRAHRAVDLVEWPELRFDVDETRALSTRLARRQFPAASVRAIHELTGGWVAGMVLLLEGTEHTPETLPDLKDHSAEVLFDYFAGEIFAKTDAVARDVLLQTAFLPTVTQSEARELTRHPAAGDVLVSLHRQNYFTTSQEHGETAYQFHPLFRRFLLSEAARHFSADQLRTVRRTAARLADASGNAETAAALLGELEDWPGLSRLLCASAPLMIQQGRTDTIERWLRDVPDASFDEHPWLLYWRAASRLWSGSAESRHDFVRALAAFREQGDGSGFYLAWSDIVMSHVIGSRSDGLDACIDLLAELKRACPTFPSQAVEAHVACSMLAAIAWHQTNHPEGAYWASRALELTRHEPASVLASAAAVCAWTYYWCAGDVTRAVRLVEEVRRETRDCDQSPAAALNIGLLEVWHDWMLNRRSERAVPSRMIELARTTGMNNATLHMLLMVGALTALRCNDERLLDECLTELSTHVSEFGPGLECWYYGTLVQVDLARNDLSAALRRLPDVIRSGVEDGWPHDAALAHVMAAQISVHLKDLADARLHAAKALEIADAMRSPYVRYMCRLVQALADIAGRGASGHEALRDAMRIGREHGYTSTHIWQPAEMARLCAAALGAGIEVDYVHRLINEGNLRPPSSDVENWPWPVRIYTFGRFTVLLEGVPLHRPGKSPRKPLDLLKCLIAMGGRDVDAAALTDALWPEADGDAARNAFDITLHRLRELLASRAVLAVSGGRVSIDPGACWIDTWAFERLERQSEIRRISTVDLDALAVDASRLADIYAGEFLAGDDLAPAHAARERFRKRFIQSIERVGDAFEQAGREIEVSRLYERALAADPDADALARRLMRWQARHAAGSGM